MSMRMISAGGGVTRGPGGGRDSPSLHILLMNRAVGPLARLSFKGERALTKASVMRLRADLNTSFKYFEECRKEYGSVIPKELAEEKPRLIDSLPTVFEEEHAARQHLFTDVDKSRAQALLDWIRNSNAAPDDSANLGNDTSTAGASSSSATNARLYTEVSGERGIIRIPDRRHPIWGREGICHGLAVTGSEFKTICYNPRYKNEKRASNNFGHNGVPIGDWYPFQLSAVFHGAHGNAQAGIYGSPQEGAYSVVVSGKYQEEGLDSDMGRVIWYSEPNASESTDVHQLGVRGPGCLTLHKSIETRKYVRVLRSAVVRKTNTSIWAPKVGLRYDGLYRVVDVTSDNRNKNNGLYQKFKLVRCMPNGVLQTPLEDLARIPSRRQWNNYERAKQYAL